MYYYFYGELVYLDSSCAAIDCNGVAYKLTVITTTANALAEKKRAKVKLFSNMQVREDSMELFGFLSEEELQAFKLLIGVSGVGPKAAMSILSLLEPARFMYAVCTEDVKALAKANGIGTKTAARIVLELHDKIAKEYLGGADKKPTAIGVSAPSPIKNGKLSEATEALGALGYDKTTIMQALKGIDPEKYTVEQIITIALKSFM